MAKKCYAVYIGRVPGVYDEWPECQAQVSWFSGGSHKGFDSRQEAEASYLRFTLARERNHNRRLMYCIIPLLLIVIALLFYIIVLDGWWNMCMGWRCSCMYSRHIITCIAISRSMMMRDIICVGWWWHDLMRIFACVWYDETIVCMIWQRLLYKTY